VVFVITTRVDQITGGTRIFTLNFFQSEPQKLNKKLFNRQGR
jgi:hypothetical protein